MSSHGISQLQKIGQEMRSFRTTLDSAGRAKILNWLVTVNPSFNHNQALDLHQGGTCKWVVKSGEWRRWKRGVKTENLETSRGIWIHGIPGAGKTILASFLATAMARIADGEDDDDDEEEIESCRIQGWLSWAMEVYDKDDKTERSLLNTWLSQAVTAYDQGADTAAYDLYDILTPARVQELLSRITKEMSDDDSVDKDGMMETATNIMWLYFATAVYDGDDDNDDKMKHERMRIKTSLLTGMKSSVDAEQTWIPCLSTIPYTVERDVSAEVGLPKLAVYYYCQHARNHEEISHFLAWLLSQMCRKAEEVPRNISNLFESDCRPQSDHLIDAIKIMAPRFSRILVSVDAVDESQKREALAEFLRRLATDQEFQCFHIVVTSRKEADIERYLGGFISLSMSNPLVDHDIALYIKDQIQTDRALQRFSSKLRAGIQDSLSSRANGMFRLAVCQLGVLKKIPVESAAWKALDQLPETLDETYERILADVPLEWTHIVKRALCLLICISVVGVEELITFASIGDSHCDDSMDTTEEDMTCEPSEEAFLEVMSCLISTTSGPTTHVRLAHYTIKEYLGSPRIVQSSASFFYLPASEAMSHSVKTMFRAIIHGSRKDESWQRFQSYCDDELLDLVKIADTVVASDKQLTALVIESMDPRMPFFCGALTISSYNKYAEPMKDGFSEQPDAGILVNLISEDLYAITTAVLLQHTAAEATRICLFEVESWNNITVVGWLAESHRNQYLHLALERCGAQINNHRQSLLICAMANFRKFDDANQTLKTLISANVSVNPGGVRVTPLQLAVWQLRVAVIETLLDNGADPNAVGQPDGWTLKQLRHFEGGMTPLSKTRMMRSLTNVDTWFNTARSDADKIEELLVNAGGCESCEWLVRDHKMH
ncbi:hypothetical protein EDB81DRAFT_51220 [Dactylonectria macrodidyma]|uniref:Nephrocystin 3-like N-terminal domain-containing protein n=1 Tax=Dactylonectria macrodidyma TaxID=307937 RepID=A0A9P9FUU5_9HYPO|nr:hypothetical protein EDB81DRAFT_51220 [Dactylonectria macrodidyma]